MEIQDIIQLQQAHHLTDEQFAQKVGRSRETWNRVKNGKQPLNDKFRMSVYRAFPDIFLPSNVTAHNKIVIPSTKSPQTHQDKRQKGFWHRVRDFLGRWGINLSLWRKKR